MSAYPKLFVYDSNEMGDYKEYLIGNNESYTELNPTTRESVLTADALDFLSGIPNAFQEFELIDASMIRIQLSDGVDVLDTTLTYQTQGSFLLVSEFQTELGDRFLEYNVADEKMYARNRAEISLPGPNAIDPDAFYYGVVAFDQADFETVEEHLNFLLTEHEYAIGDTVIVFEPRRVFD